MSFSVRAPIVFMALGSLYGSSSLWLVSIVLKRNSFE
jgi:hypothetical protein